MRPIRPKSRHSLLAAIILLALATAVGAEEPYRHLPGVIEVHTSFDRTGKYSLDELVEMVRQAGLEVLIPTDHDLQAMEYGVPLLRNLVRKRVELPSILQAGADRYLAEIERVNQRQRDVLIVPGAQSSPFYYWSGRPFSDDFTVHNYRKELLLIGMTASSDYNGLPLLHRGFSTRYSLALLPRFLIFCIAAVLGILLAIQSRFFRRFGIGLAILALILAADAHPFKGSRFDPYHGDPGIGPYQDLIDYVNPRGGLVFWSHPESRFAIEGERLGPVVFKTPIHLDDLDRSTGYAGFTALYGDTTTAEQPGGKWDRLLADYCQGRRSHPVWAISGADYHDGANGTRIDTFQTVFLVREKTTRAVMDALATGRMYALRKTGQGPHLALERFEVEDSGLAKTAIMGETLGKAAKPSVRVRVAAADGSRQALSLELIRGGQVITTEKAQTPVELEVEDAGAPKGKTFYRVCARGPKVGQLLSNPIFVVTK